MKTEVSIGPLWLVNDGGAISDTQDREEVLLIDLHDLGGILGHAFQARGKFSKEGGLGRAGADVQHQVSRRIPH